MKARKYNSDVVSDVVKVTMRSSRRGDLFYLVEYNDNDNVERYVTFEKLSSVIDFIQSNF